MLNKTGFEKQAHAKKAKSEVETKKSVLAKEEEKHVNKQLIKNVKGAER